MISVIIPVYNAEKFLEETIESILVQSYKDFELILINDGSKDNSERICKKYQNNDSRIKYYSKNNTGVSDTRNYGLKKAEGDYIVFVDSDDTLPFNAFQVYMDEIQKNNADIIFANHAYNYNGKIISRSIRVQLGIYNYEELRPRLVDDGTLTGILFGSVCGVCYKKSIIDYNQVRFYTDIKRNEDGLFNIQILLYCNKVQVLDDSLYYYRQWKTEKKDKLEIDRELIKCDKKLYEMLKNRNELEYYKVQLLRRKVSVAFWNAIRVKTAMTDFKEAKRYLNELFSKQSVVNGLTYMDYKKMNQYKLLLCKLIKYKAVRSFYFLIRFIVPIVEKKIKR